MAIKSAKRWHHNRTRRGQCVINCKKLASVYTFLSNICINIPPKVWNILFDLYCSKVVAVSVIACICFVFSILDCLGVFFFRYLSGRFIIWLMDVFIITWHYDDKDLFFNYRYELHLEDLTVSLCNFFVFQDRKKGEYFIKSRNLLHVTILINSGSKWSIIIKILILYNPCRIYPIRFTANLKKKLKC